jgi:hypothetical protein
MENDPQFRRVKGINDWQEMYTSLEDGVLSFNPLLNSNWKDFKKRFTHSSYESMVKDLWVMMSESERNSHECSVLLKNNSTP